MAQARPALAALLCLALAGCAQPVCEGYKVPPPKGDAKPTAPPPPPATDPAPPR